MRKTYKVLCVVLCAVLLSLLFLPVAFAETKQGKITADSVYMRDKATTEGSKTLFTFSKDTVVTINSTVSGQEAISGAGKTWYNVSYGGKTGYVYGKFVMEIAAAVYDENFEKNLLNFPSSYRAALRTIHKTYPNWVFVADKVGVSLNTAIGYEYSATSLYSTKKWVELTYGLEWRDPRVDLGNSNDIKETRWTYASRQSIAYFLDPRNALTVTTAKNSFPNIFTFLQQSYDSATQNKEGLRTVVSGTFMAGGYGGNKDAYINDIMEAAKQSGVSPYVIASTIRIEQGVKGTSSLISGTYKGYEGYYNFFNYGAYEHDKRSVVVNGLIYAKDKKWNSRKAAIVGGAKLFAEGYINKGQDTYYYMDFNVKSKGTHQYATSLYDQCIKAVSMRTVCTVNKNAAMTFKIPVYSSLPSSVCKAPTMEEYNSSLAANNNNSSSSNSSSSKASSSATSSKAKKAGDVNNDGKVTVVDFAAIRMHLLGVKKMTSAQCEAADVTGDKVVNVKDFAMIRMFLLGIVKL